MKILIFNWRDWKNPKAGGAEVVTLEHAKAWIKAGHTVTWFSSTFPGAKEEETAEGIEIIRKGSAYTVYAYAPFFYLFSGRKFDIIIDEIHGIPFFTPLYVRKPKIAFIHEVAGEIWEFMFSFPLNKIGKFIEKSIFIFYKKVHFLTVSESTKVELTEEGIPEHNISVIHNGISIQAVNTLPVKEKRPTLLFISRLVKMKGIEDVLIAFAIAKEQEPAAQLWIIGSGEKTYENNLKNLIQKLGVKNDVTFFGFIAEKEKIKLMQKAHILLHASVKEGWGLVVTEAASQGTPAVVYNVSGLRDAVVQGETGIVLEMNTPQEMAKQAIRVLESPELYKKMQQKCLARTQTLTWEKATKESTLLVSNLHN